MGNATAGMASCPSGKHGLMDMAAWTISAIAILLVAAIALHVSRGR